MPGHKPDYDFKLDLPKGEEAERTIAFLLNMQDGDLIEVKRDFIVSDTGNIAIEYECRDEPSGIATTRAAWWAILLDGLDYNGAVIVLIRTGRLKAIARKLYHLEGRVVPGGDNGSAKMVLLPVGDLLKSA